MPVPFDIFFYSLFFSRKRLCRRAYPRRRRLHPPCCPSPAVNNQVSRQQRSATRQANSKWQLQRLEGRWMRRARAHRVPCAHVASLCPCGDTQAWQQSSSQSFRNSEPTPLFRRPKHVRRELRFHHGSRARNEDMKVREEPAGRRVGWGEEQRKLCVC